VSKIETKGLIFNIQRFSIHDGPGIRTVVFFKGCPLECVWCSNPESQSPDPEMFFSPLKCIGCGLCIEACENKAVNIRDNKIINDKSKCANCRKCEDVCPTGARALAGKEMSAEEVIKELEKDCQFYRRSGGGVTFSGGEPVLQGEFVRELAEELKKRNIHTAIETTGFADWDIFRDAVKNVDLVLYDLKAFNPEKHMRFTGTDNRCILDNARKIAGLKEVIFRIPVIPGFNEQVEDMENLAGFISECKPGGEVHVIPYHALGKPKYERLGKVYALAEVKPPSGEELARLKDIFTAKGLKTEIY